MDIFERTAEAAIARPKPRRTTPSRTPVAPARDPLSSFHVEVESIVGRLVRQVREAEEGQARTLLKLAYEAGFDDAADEVARCCGCNIGDAADFDGFVERLLKAAT